MINLNLISPKQKKYLKTCFGQKSVQKIFISFLSSVLLITIFSVGVNTRLKNLDEQLQTKLQSDQSIYNQATNIINQANLKINQLESLKPSSFSWSKYLAELDKVIPTSISLYKLDISLDGQQIFIQGFADKRDNFLAFQKALENSKLINNIYTPINNLLQETNVNFVISGKIKL